MSLLKSYPAFYPGSSPCIGAASGGAPAAGLNYALAGSTLNTGNQLVTAPASYWLDNSFPVLAGGEFTDISGGINITRTFTDPSQSISLLLSNAGAATAYQNLSAYSMVYVDYYIHAYPTTGATVQLYLQDNSGHGGHQYSNVLNAAIGLNTIPISIAAFVAAGGDNTNVNINFGFFCSGIVPAAVYNVDIFRVRVQ